METPIVRDADRNNRVRLIGLLLLLFAMISAVIIGTGYLGYQAGFRAGAVVGYDFARNHSTCLIPNLPVP